MVGANSSGVEINSFGGDIDSSGMASRVCELSAEKRRLGNLEDDLERIDGMEKIG